MKREDFIPKLDETVVKRRGVYAPPERNFGRIAKLWSVYLDDKFGSGYPSNGAPIELAETDVAIMCGMIKIARLMEDPKHEDSWLDLAGYACCGSEVSERASNEVRFESRFRKGPTGPLELRNVMDRTTASVGEGPAACFRRVLEGAGPHEAVEWPKGLSYQEVYDICADVRKAREFDAKFKAACQDARTADEKIEDAALDANEKVEAKTVPTTADFKVGDRVRYEGFKKEVPVSTGSVVEADDASVTVLHDDGRMSMHAQSAAGLVKLPPDTLDPRNFEIKIGGLYRHKGMASLHQVTGTFPGGPLVSAVPWPSRSPLFSYSYDKDDFLARFERVPPAEEAELLKDES